MGDHTVHAEQIHKFYKLMFSLEVVSRNTVKTSHIFMNRLCTVYWCGTWTLWTRIRWSRTKLDRNTYVSQSKTKYLQIIQNLKPGRNGGQASWCQRSAVKMTTRRSSTCAASKEIMNLGSFSTGSGAVIVLTVTPIWRLIWWKTNIGVAIGAMASMRRFAPRSNLQLKRSKFFNLWYLYNVG